LAMRALAAAADLAFLGGICNMPNQGKVWVLGL